MEKAFDRIPHPIIIAAYIKMAKLNREAVYLAHWTRAYLANRTFRVRIGSTISREAGEIKAGVPQGSSTGPVSFNMSTMDAPDPAVKAADLDPEITLDWSLEEMSEFNRRGGTAAIKLEASTFADDQSAAVMLNLRDSTKDGNHKYKLAAVRSHLKKQEKFAANNKMRYNPGKCKLLLANRNRDHNIIVLTNKTI